MITKRAFIGSIAACVAASPAFAQDRGPVRIALLEPMSGVFANVGLNLAKAFQFEAERANRKNPQGPQLQVVAFDNKASAQEAISVLRSVIDQGFRYVVQITGSSIGSALSEAIGKHNERNPGKEIIYFVGGQDTALSNEKCSYWQFNFESDTSMKMQAFGAYVAQTSSIGKVYLLNPDYSHGREVAHYAKESIKAARPGGVVGEEYFPLGQVKDFTPYVSKIRASGADTVLTGNWGQDMSLLARAIADAGLKLNLFAPLAFGVGNAYALSSAAKAGVKIYSLATGQPNLAGEYGQVSREFAQKTGEYYGMGMVFQLFQILPAAFRAAGSTDPQRVVKALETVSAEGASGAIAMRAADHRLQQGVFVTAFVPVDAKNSFEVEGSGYTWITEKFFDAKAVSTPTTCRMKRA